MENTKPKIIVVVGPTASGKTSLSITLAKKFSGEVISADSRQVYKNLDIGTEKITKEETQGVPHHLIDVCEINTVYTAVDFKQDGEAAIAEIINNKNLPILAGGTFFYIDTLLGKVTTPEAPPNPKLRAELEKKDTAVLYESLLKLDPRRAEDIDPHNKRRIVRALEVVAALGTVPELPEATELPYDICMIGIEVDKKELRTRIRRRAEEALTRGLIEETQQLLESGVTKARLSEIGLEYRVVMEYLDNDIDEAGLIQKIEEKNWQYAKRQIMWLKRDDSIQWIELNEINKITAEVEKFLTS